MIVHRTSVLQIRTGAAEPEANAPTERTETVDHGDITTSWSPENGGTTHVTDQSPGKKPLAIAGGIGLGTGSLALGNCSSKAERAVAAAAGSSADDVFRAGQKAFGRNVNVGLIATFGTLLAGAVLADRSRSNEHSTKAMSWSEYRDARFEKPLGKETSWTRDMTSVGLGLVAGSAAGFGVERLLPNVSHNVRYGAGSLGFMAAAIGTTILANKALEKIGA